MDVEASMAIAYRHWAARELADAECVCSDILSACPGHGAALHLSSLIASARGRPGLAVDYAERACASPGAPAGFHDDLAELYRRQGRLAEAAAAARRALALDASRAVTWHRLGLVLAAAGDFGAGRLVLERAVELEPDNVETRNNLGLVLQRLGELEQARWQYLAALRLAPDKAGPHGNLAAVLGELGEPREALAEAKRAMALDATLIGPYVCAGLAEAALGRHDAALQWLDQAVALAPDEAGVLVARAEALRVLDRAEEGRVDCERAIALQPDNGEAHNLLGLLLRALNRDEDALAAFERAARLLPEPGMAVVNHATTLLQLGRRGEAMAELDATLAREPTFAAAWYTRADAKTFVAGDPDIAAMEGLLVDGDAHRPRLPPSQIESDRLLLRYALGKAYLDIGNGEQAFAHLQEGSRLKRARLDYDAEDKDRWFAAIIASFPAELFERLGGAGDPSEAPVFVVGMPRSGTTLVEQLLASHPRVHGAGEPRHLETVLHQGELGVYPDYVGRLQREQLAALGRRYLALVQERAPRADRIVDKMPTNFLYAGLVSLILNNARIIHCRRDPVDTCLSCYSKLFTTGQDFSYDLAELGRYYRGYEALMDHWRRMLPARNFIEVIYEEVVDDLETQARRLVHFCGLPWDDACLRFHETRRAVRTASMNQVRTPLYRSSIGRWRRFETQLRPLLTALAGE